MNLMRKTRKLFTFVLSLLLVVTLIPNFSTIFAEDGGASYPDQQITVEQQTDIDAGQDVQAGQNAATDQSADVEESSTKGDAVVDEAAVDEVEKAEPEKDNAKDAETDAEKAEPEKKQESKESKPEEITATQFTKEVDGIVVDVETEAGAFSEDVTLVVTPVEEGTVKYLAAKIALKANKQTYDGMLAYDIHFENSQGKEVEPNGAVAVKMTAKAKALKGIDTGAFDAGSVKVTHIGNDATEIVADTDDNSKIEGTVAVDATEKAVQEIGAEFDVDSFSTFTLTWTEDGNDKSATIHWGTYEDEGFKEFDSTTTVDTTASSVDLAVNISGYYFVGVDYLENEDAEPEYLEGVSVLKKVDGAWKLGDTAVADGSHIYVNYAPKNDGSYTPPSTTIPEDYPAPETKKKVKKNDDGTFTIQLDITGHENEEVTQVGANVIVVMDITQSMTDGMPGGGGSRMAAAKSALNTLINTLDPDTNLINFTAVNFGNSANYYNGVSWTTTTNGMRNYVNGLPNNPTDMGTCWQAGLQGGIDRVGQAQSDPQMSKNETYVIFVTDGNPNCYQDSSGGWHGASGPDFNQQAYNAAVPNANALGSSSHLYGVFVGDANGYGHLNDLITGAQGTTGDGYTVNGTSETQLKEAFGNIAQTIVDNLGSGSVVVDDGIPSLSNVSANVTGGEAGGFEYYITPKGGSQQEWDAAPGASYDESNGVTWDLGEAGTLKDGYVYTLKFTVWPSQEAYDYIADLNNGLVDPVPTEEELEEQGIEKDANGKYTLKTNTHLGVVTFK